MQLGAVPSNFFFLEMSVKLSLINKVKSLICEIKPYQQRKVIKFYHARNLSGVKTS